MDNGKDKLDKLKKELYARDESEELLKREEDIKSLGIRQHKIPKVDEGQPIVLKNMINKQKTKRRKIIKWIIIVVAFLALLASAVAGNAWWRVRSNVHEAQLGITLSASKELTAGEEIEYVATYKNDSHVDWRDVEVAFEPPAGFTLTEKVSNMDLSDRQYVLAVGNLRAGEQKKVRIRGRLVGEEGASVVAKVKLSVTPVNFSTGRYSKTALHTVVITAIPVDLAMNVPKEVAAGEKVVADLKVTNTGTNDFSNSYLKLKLAPGMQLATEDQQFTANFSVLDGYWLLPTLKPLEEANYRVVMFLDGQAGEQRNLEVEIGVIDGDKRFVQRALSSTISISATEMTIKQEYNNSSGPIVLKAGEIVKGKISYMNSGTVGLKDAIVRVKFDGEALDESSLNLSSGAFDPRTKTITWTSSTVPELALLQPQQTGEIEYEFAIKEIGKLAVDKGGKQIVIISASIDSADLSILSGQDKKNISDRFVVSIASDLTLEVDSFYDDGRLGIKSIGPLPPEVGQTTSYTVRLRLGSTLNDVGNIKVIAVLPDGVEYTEKVVKTAGEVSFNKRTKEIVWSVPLLESLTGRALPAKELSFQVAITPGEHLRGKNISFLNQLVATGVDMFTDTDLSVEVKGYPTTSTADSGKGEVQ